MMREPNLLGWREVIGRWMAAFIPVPRMTARRVEGLTYARARTAAEASLTMAETETLRFCFGGGKRER